MESTIYSGVQCACRPMGIAALLAPHMDANRTIRACMRSRTSLRVCTLRLRLQAR